MGIESLTERFRSVIVNGNGDKRKLMCAASLAHYGLLYSVARLVLRYVGLSRVPAQQLASLTSRVTSEPIIRNVSGGYLVSLLSSLKCKWLDITSQSLGREETQALVQAMESGVKRVMLGGGLTLDMDTLAEYSGQGACWRVTLWDDTAAKYWED